MNRAASAILSAIIALYAAISAFSISSCARRRFAMADSTDLVADNLASSTLSMAFCSANASCSAAASAAQEQIIQVPATKTKQHPATKLTAQKYKMEM